MTKVAGYTITPKQLATLHGLYQGLVSDGTPRIYGVSVKPQLDALADAGIIARTGMGAYMIQRGSAGDKIIAATPDFSVAATF